LIIPLSRCETSLGSLLSQGVRLTSSISNALLLNLPPPRPFVNKPCSTKALALGSFDGAEPLQEQAVRTAFGQAAIPPFLESGVPGRDGPMRLLRYALPNAVAEATGVITALFQEGFGVNGATPVAGGVPLF
jgi:hypothetical protein